MKNVYGIKRDDYHGDIYMVCDNYNDALKIAAANKEYDDDKAKDYVVKLPYLASAPEKVELQDVDTLVNLAINTAFKAVERAEKRGDE